MHYKIYKMTSIIVKEYLECRVPYNLLLLADETKEAIDKYITESRLFAAYLSVNETLPIAVMALYKQSLEVLEIKNIAILEEFQSKGIGAQLILFAKEYAIQNGFKKIIVGTGDVNERQIKFYEKCGFKQFGVRKNFFIDNYPQPIYDEGKQLIDMALLQLIIN